MPSVVASTASTANNTLANVPHNNAEDVVGLAGGAVSSNASNNESVSPVDDGMDLDDDGQRTRTISPDNVPPERETKRQKSARLAAMPLDAAEIPSHPRVASISQRDLTAFRKTDLLKKESYNDVSSIRPKNRSKARKVPHHFVATGNWDKAAYNTHHFFHNLSYDEQDIECEKFRRLPKKEKKRLKSVIVRMMDDVKKSTARDNVRAAAPERTSARVAEQDNQRQLDELVAASAARMQTSVMQQRAQEIVGETNADRGSNGGRVQQPKPVVEPSNHIGVGSTEEERASLLEGRKKEKSKPRKMGENAKSVGAQSDATAIKSQKRLMTEACKTIKTCTFTGKKEGDPGNRFVLIQLNEVGDSRPTGGTHAGKSREKPRLTITANSKEDAKHVLKAVSKALGRDVATKDDFEVQWVAAMDGISLDDKLEEATTALLGPRRRKSKKRRGITDIQQEENPGK